MNGNKAIRPVDELMTVLMWPTHLVATASYRY